MDSELNAAYKQLGWVIVGIVTLVFLFDTDSKVGTIIFIAVILGMVFAGLRSGNL